MSSNAIVSPLDAFRAIGVDVHYEPGNTTEAAAAAARAADVVVVFGSAHSGEGSDRKDLRLGGNIDDVIAAVALVASNKTVVVMSVASVFR